MTVKTKFNAGETVWIRINGLPVQGEVQEINIWSRGGEPEILYRLFSIDALVKESDIAQTKQQLFTL